MEIKNRKTVLSIAGMLIAIIIFVLFKLPTASGEIIIVEANPERGFSYEYHLYIPNGVEKSIIKYMLVEPNNTGIVSDNHDIHIKKVENLIQGYPRRIACELKVPLLIPVFDRPESDWKMYTHSLDSDSECLYKAETDSGCYHRRTGRFPKRRPSPIGSAYD